MISLYVNTSSTVGTQNGTTNTPGNSGTAAFATLRQAIDSLGTLADATTIFCDGSGGPDTGDITQAPWNFVTSATNYLLITAVGANRASMVWSDSKYISQGTNKSPGHFYQNTPCHVRVDGIQIRHIQNDGATGKIIFKAANQNQTAVDIDMRLSNCHLRGVATNGSTITGIECRPYDGVTGAGTTQHWNCIVTGCQQGVTNDLPSGSFYNITVVAPEFGFVDGTSSMIVKNSLVTGATGVGFVGPFHASSNYNAEDDGNGAPGANSRSNQTFTFIDAAGGNYRLAEGDAGAKDFGVTNPSGGALFTTDLDGNTRGASWDIGASEWVPSVGQSPRQTQSRYRYVLDDTIR